MKPIVRVSLLLGLLLGFVVLPVQAQPMPNVVVGGNRWLITFFNDPTPTHTQWATQGLCFLTPVITGTGISGKWYSDTFPNWNGLYFQEGDRVTMTGDYANEVGHDGIEFDIAGVSTASLATGHWKEWREDPGFGFIIGWGNARLVRVGKCFLPGVAAAAISTTADAGEGAGENQEELAALQFSMNVPPRMLRGGGVAESPAQPGQLPVRHPEKREHEDKD